MGKITLGLTKKDLELRKSRSEGNVEFSRSFSPKNALTIFFRQVQVNYLNPMLKKY